MSAIQLNKIHTVCIKARCILSCFKIISITTFLHWKQLPSILVFSPLKENALGKEKKNKDHCFDLLGQFINYMIGVLSDERTLVF